MFFSPHGPALRKWDQDTGELTYECWHDEEGKLHRGGNKPARIKVNPYSKVIECEEYFIHGQQHRLLEGAPATIRRDPVSGKVVHEEWWHKGTLHRDFAKAAIISRDEDTNVVTYEAYYTKGEFVEAIERDFATGKGYWEPEEPETQEKPPQRASGRPLAQPGS
jgi:hypothetical protein